MYIGKKSYKVIFRGNSFLGFILLDVFIRGFLKYIYIYKGIGRFFIWLFMVFKEYLIFLNNILYWNIYYVFFNKKWKD